MDAFEVLQSQINELKQQIEKQPKFKRGEITNINPLRVKWDGSDPLDGEPDSHVPVSQLRVGDYVDLRLQGTRTIIQSVINDDTGWVPVVAASGFVSNGFVRRRDGVLHFQGTLNGSLAANTTTVIGTSPLGHSGPTRVVGTSTTGGFAIDYLDLYADGTIRARNAVAVSSNISLAPLSGALVD